MKRVTGELYLEWAVVVDDNQTSVDNSYPTVLGIGVLQVRARVGKVDGSSE